MTCQKCGSRRVAQIDAKCDDRCCAQVEEFESNDYVPSDWGIGGGDYVRFKFCMQCGTIQGDFPLLETDMEQECPE